MLQCLLIFWKTKLIWCNVNKLLLILTWWLHYMTFLESLNCNFAKTRHTKNRWEQLDKKGLHKGLQEGVVKRKQGGGAREAYGWQKQQSHVLSQDKYMTILVQVMKTSIDTRNKDKTNRVSGQNPDKFKFFNRKLPCHCNCSITVIILQVLGMLPVQILSGYPYNIEEWEPNPCPYPESVFGFAEGARRKRSRFYYPQYYNNFDDNDVYNIFKVRHTTRPISHEVLQYLTVHYSSCTQ